MAADYVEADLPDETITVNGKRWEREEFDADSYQWRRAMYDGEYDWNPGEEDVSLVGTKEPIRVVTLQFRGGEWTVEAAETAGPNYHRPGFTELISSEYSEQFDDADAAFKTVQDFIQRLS